MFEFQWPWVFGLLLLPIIFRKWVKPARPPSSQALIIPFIDELDRSPADRTCQSNFKLALILLAAWSLLITAAAKPVWVDNAINLPISHRNIIIAVDLSGSMAQKDFVQEEHLVTRLSAAKTVAADFINHRTGDKIGLILFADHAYLQAPLTRDRPTVIQLLSEAEIGLAGQRTALGNAIGLAVKKVQQQADQEHVLVLMTDGAATVGINIDEAISFATKEKLKIYTLGIGSDHKTTQDTQHLSRNTSKDGFNNLSSRLDEATLKKIAIQTGGRYFKATNVRELEFIYSEIDKLEPVVDNSKAWHPQKDLFHIPLLLFTLLMIAIGLIRGQRQ
jgi:Ca-activated chloride channel family protein